MKNLLVSIIFATTFISGCTTDHTDVMRVLKAEGITQIELTGYTLFGCGGEISHLGFKGIKNNQKVKGVICGGGMLDTKAMTIRYF